MDGGLLAGSSLVSAATPTGALSSPPSKTRIACDNSTQYHIIMLYQLWGISNKHGIWSMFSDSVPEKNSPGYHRFTVKKKLPHIKEFYDTVYDTR